jgi:hypothetical protein
MFPADLLSGRDSGIMRAKFFDGEVFGGQQNSLAQIPTTNE